MNKMWIVARREYLFNLRRPAFLFAVFGVPLFTFFMWGIIFLVIGNNETNIDQIGKVGFVDKSNLLSQPLFPKQYPDLFVPYVDESTARNALDRKAIGAYIVLPADYMQTGNVSTYSYSGLPEALKNAIDDFLLLNLNQRLNGQISLERIQKPVNLTIHVGDSGRILTESSVTALFFIPLIFAMVFMMSSNVTSGFLMNGVVEEKTNRIMEILITSVTPGQLLLGKIIGLGVLGLTQMVVWGIAGGVLLQVGQRFPFLAGVTFPSDLVIIFVVYFILSYFLLASLMAGLGAVAGSEQESRQYAGIISLIWVIPFFFIASFITEPNGTLPIVLTFIPFTAPMTALLRLGFSAVPAWQIVVSLVILLLTTILVVWGSGRVFRWALLLYGKRITPREVWSAIRQPSGTATVATAHTAEEGAV